MFPLETMFRLAPISEVTPYSMSDSLNSEVLGLLGASVTGIYISGAIQFSGEACSVNGVTVEFICAGSPAEV